MADSFVDTAGGLQQVPTVNVVEKPDQPYVATDGSMQSAVAVNVLSGGIPADGVALTDGETVNVLSADGNTQIAQGTADIDTSTDPNTLNGIDLPATDAIVSDGGEVPLQNHTGSARGNITAVVAGNAVTAGQLPEGTDTVVDAASVPVLNSSGDTTLATGTARVPISDFGGVQLQPTDAIASNGATVNVSTTDGTVPAEISVSGNAIQEVSLTDGTDTIISDGMTSPASVTGTYVDTVTFTVAGGVVTAIHLS